MAMFEVVFETPLYRSVFVEADDADEASEKAIDRHYPAQISLPHGYEAEQDNWFVGGVVRVRDDD